MKAREAPGRLMVAAAEHLAAHVSEAGAWAGTAAEARRVCSGLSGVSLPASQLCLVCIVIQGPWAGLTFPVFFFFP